jgi:hypothetical protein
MARQEIHLEQLLSRRVRDADGRVVGRIEEVRAERRGEEYWVQEYHLGPHAVLERLSLWLTRLPPLHLLTLGQQGKSYKASWDQIDVTDPEHPRLRCAKQDLQEL